MQMGYIL